MFLNLFLSGSSLDICVRFRGEIISFTVQPKLLCNDICFCLLSLGLNAGFIQGNWFVCVCVCVCV